MQQHEDQRAGEARDGVGEPRGGCRRRASSSSRRMISSMLRAAWGAALLGMAARSSDAWPTPGGGRPIRLSRFSAA
jgi:hypothetical protein